MTTVRIGVNDTGWGLPFKRLARSLDDFVPWERYLDEAAAAGFDGIELSPAFDGEATALHEALAGRGLTLSGAVIAGHLEDETAWTDLEKRARRAADALTPFGARHLVLIDMLSLDGAPRALDEREWARLIESTHRLAHLAAEFGLILAVHPHADSHLETEAQIARFLDETDPALVSLCLDTGHLAYQGIDPVTFFSNHHQRVSYLHLKNIRADILDRHRRRRLPWVQAVRDGISDDLTEGVVDLTALGAELDEIGYEGWAIVEMDRTPTRGDEPLRMATKAREYLRKIGIG